MGSHRAQSSSLPPRYHVSSSEQLRLKGDKVSDEILGRGGVISKRNGCVVRPLNKWSASVHLLLSHLHQKGFHQCPALVAIEEKCEVLSFVAGDCYDYPLQGAIATEQALISAAQLLREFHDASSDFLQQHVSDKLVWMLPSREPQQVICHGDYAPYNLALNGDSVRGIFDFDTVHPGPRIWDIAYAIYCFAPFKTDVNDRLGSLEQQTYRARLFCDIYGVSSLDRGQLVDNMVQRLQALVTFMHQQAEQDNRQLIENLQDGHHLAYLSDIEYLIENKRFISDSIIR
ncbi:aminoglycoside phosphotransferase family protein [Vibrio panuliri]